MELVAAEDISNVLEDAMHEASDPKQRKALSNMSQYLLGPSEDQSIFTKG
jgi:hypothetical protein